MFDKVNVIGSYPFIARRTTGLFSLDLALSSRGELGAPMRSIYEVYGYPNSGKSTLTYYLSGKLTPSEEISVCDLEMLDMNYLRSAVGMSGFRGNVRVMDLQDKKGKALTHEQVMRQMVQELEKQSGAVILDSVGAIQPLAEAAGDFGEAFVGKRAKLVAQVARATSNALRLKEEEAIAFVINHTHQIIGGRGHTTAGGETLKYLAAVRMMIWSQEVIKDTAEENILGFLVAGQIEKLRFGGRGRQFSYYIVPGIGVHPGVSAMFDCFEYGLAKRDATVKIDGKSLGYLKKDLLTYALSGKNRKFEPFQELLQEHEKTLKYREDDYASTNSKGKIAEDDEPMDPEPEGDGDGDE